MKRLFSVFDWETTGLTVHPDSDLDKQPRPIEFAGIITDGNEIIHQLEFICNPGMAIEEIITRITGLKNEDLAGKPPFEHFIPHLTEYFGKADVAIAHNLSFDRNITKYALARTDKELSDVNFPAICCCTVEQLLPLFGRRMRLEDLYNKFVGEYVQKHRALDDVLLLHKLCQKFGVYDAFSSAAD